MPIPKLEDCSFIFDGIAIDNINETFKATVLICFIRSLRRFTIILMDYDSTWYPSLHHRWVIDLDRIWNVFLFTIATNNFITWFHYPSLYKPNLLLLDTNEQLSDSPKLFHCIHHTHCRGLIHHIHHTHIQQQIKIHHSAHSFFFNWSIAALNSSLTLSPSAAYILRTSFNKCTRSWLANSSNSSE